MFNIFLVGIGRGRDFWVVILGYGFFLFTCRGGIGFRVSRFVVDSIIFGVRFGVFLWFLFYRIS